ncbi:MAG: Card1-like endonuclease domain-containing protein [Anaerolineaceae bacterium]
MFFDTQNKLIAEIYDNQNQKVLINLTSGTKIMSLACLQAAQGRDVELVYVSTQTNELLFFHPTSARESKQTIKLAISCKQYFGAHGFDANSNPNFSNPYPPNTPPKSGDELEEQVYVSLKESGLFDDVQRNLFIRRSMGKEDSVVNEFDVLATYNGNMAICSCKSGKVDKQNRYIYELSALTSRELAGIYCQRFLISSQADRNIPDGLKNRAQTNRVKIIGQEQLPNVADIIFKSLK